MDQANKQKILVVDDIQENIDLLFAVLSHDYTVMQATNGKSALDMSSGSTPPDIILLDVQMPGMDGFEVCRKLKENPATRNIPVIFVTALGESENESAGFAAGGVDYIPKPISPAIVSARVKTHLALYDQNRYLEKKVKERTRELNDTRLEIVRRLGIAAEYKDNETGMHVLRMSKYCHLIALECGLPENEAELIFNASPMHDVGKIGIPDKILLKPGKLDEDEWNTMKTHCRIGFEIIGEHSSELLKTAAIAALAHHEKWDGSGYPNGVKGDDIPLIGRIVAVADIFDALTSKRPYKDPWPAEKALDLIRNEKGKHLDPSIADAFLAIEHEILEIMNTMQ
jgi:putative two-component system response regulator